MKLSNKNTWPYTQFLEHLADIGKMWQPNKKDHSSKMLVADMALIPKAWDYFLHHNLDTNRSRSYLTIERALELYMFLTKYTINIRRIIVGDMDSIA